VVFLNNLRGRMPLRVWMVAKEASCTYWMKITLFLWNIKRHICGTTFMWFLNAVHEINAQCRGNFCLDVSVTKTTHCVLIWYWEVWITPYKAKDLSDWWQKICKVPASIRWVPCIWRPPFCIATCTCLLVAEMKTLQVVRGGNINI